MSYGSNSSSVSYTFTNQLNNCVNSNKLYYNNSNYFNINQLTWSTYDDASEEEVYYTYIANFVGGSAISGNMYFANDGALIKDYDIYIKLYGIVVFIDNVTNYCLFIQPVANSSSDSEVNVYLIPPSAVSFVSYDGFTYCKGVNLPDNGVVPLYNCILTNSADLNASSKTWSLTCTDYITEDQLLEPTDYYFSSNSSISGGVETFNNSFNINEQTANTDELPSYSTILFLIGIAHSGFLITYFNPDYPDNDNNNQNTASQIFLNSCALYQLSLNLQ